MSSAIDPLVEEACTALGVEAPSPLLPGGQKSVFLVRRGGEAAVLKIVHIAETSPETLKRAQREVQLLQSLDSPYVVRGVSALVEIGKPPDAVAWLEEYLEGSDLRELVGNPWTWAQARAFAENAGAGLAALHEKGVVHRDLSASNVRRCSRDDRFVLIDPGFAKHTLKSSVTVGGQPGTQGFLSPEHLQGYSGGPTAASDVFALGNLLFLVLTGSLAIPLTANDAEADYFARLLDGKTEQIGDYRPDLSKPRADFVMQCLHPHPARRPLNGRRFLEALSEVP